MDYWRYAVLGFGLGALVFKGHYVYVSFYAALSIYLVSRWLVRFGFRKLEFRRTMESDHIFPGEDTGVTIVVRNGAPVPIPWVGVRDEIVGDSGTQGRRWEVFSLGARGAKEWTYRIGAHRRGVLRVGPALVETGDPLGLDRRSAFFEPSAREIVVYPKLRPLEHFALPSRLPVGEVRSSQRIFEDPARIAGIREYTDKDSLKRIHWKVSARTGRLHVKEYDPSMAIENLMLLNLDAREYDPSQRYSAPELAIEVAASVAYHLHKRRQGVGLVTNGADPAATEDARAGGRPAALVLRPGTGQLVTLLEMLARVQVSEGVERQGFCGLITEHSRRLPWGGTVIAITPKDTVDMMNVVASLRRSGFNVVIILVGGVAVHRELLFRGPESGLVMYEVRREQDVDALGLSRKAAAR